MSVAFEVERGIESHRSELTAYCHRILGSPFDADDAVQEILLRAWRGAASFQGRASLRTWLYRIASNVCFDAVDGRSRRPIPTDELPETVDIGGEADPPERALARDDLRLALTIAVGNLPPRQRAVLMLRDVLGWRAAEVAELLGTTVPAVNSALQRAHANLDCAELDSPSSLGTMLSGELIARYLAAFDTDDVDALTALTASCREP